MSGELKLLGVLDEEKDIWGKQGRTLHMDYIEKKVREEVQDVEGEECGLHESALLWKLHRHFHRLQVLPGTHL